jgi:hypothetical protein
VIGVDTHRSAILGQSHAGDRRRHREHVLFRGPPSGAAYLVAGWSARRNPGAPAAVVVRDEGRRYPDTVYADARPGAQGVRLDVLAHAPVAWDRPHDGGAPLSFHRWARRRLGDATGAPDAALERVA